MSTDQQSHPLHGLGLKAMLTELVDHYGWPILAEQIPVNCFMSLPSVNSSVKFLHKTTWARERLEAFYLYKFKQCPLPSDEQHKLAPRNRDIDISLMAHSPAEINLGDKEFFDDPASGPVFPSRAQVQSTTKPKKTALFQRDNSRESLKEDSAPQSSNDPQAELSLETQPEPDAETDSQAEPEKVIDKKKKTSASADPWAKWNKT